MLYFGVLHFNNPSKKTYPIRGVDVSSYQGTIDWKELANNDLHFAFVKATEGSTFVDKYFLNNWTESNKTQLYVGAYHFFSFESSGATQAENFIKTVGKLNTNNLPPVIDIEYYNSDLEISIQDIREEILNMATALEKEYGKKPILYVTKETYEDFVVGYFENFPIWVRSVFYKPNFVKEWNFWQYSNRHILDGYKGSEKYIDMNVYNGDFESFLNDFKLEEK